MVIPGRYAWTLSKLLSQSFGDLSTLTCNALTRNAQWRLIKETQHFFLFKACLPQSLHSHSADLWCPCPSFYLWDRCANTPFLQISKCFNGSGVVGPWIPIEEFEDYLQQEFQFKLDGEIRQRGTGDMMRLAPEQAIEYVDSFFPLQDGDVVFTGTPAGVGEVKTDQVGQLVWGDRLKYEVKF